MNIKETIDYSKLFSAVDRAVNASLRQMELYQEIGRLICERPEKGAAVAVAEHLHSTHPDAGGFSPRNVRRMREFYRMYENTPSVMQEAMKIRWTQNVVILETNLSLEERKWYICAARRFGWSKLTLIKKIAQCAHEDHTLDTDENPCYTVLEQEMTEGIYDGDASGKNQTREKTEPVKTAEGADWHSAFAGMLGPCLRGLSRGLLSCRCGSVGCFEKSPFRRDGCRAEEYKNFIHSGRSECIFYPGGKVQYEAYAPLMEECAKQGILCVLLHMPGNLAVLDMNAADGIIEAYPEITEWYIGGHSLGGAMAASYAARHTGDYEGLVLLAAYSTNDISDNELQVLSVYGTEDCVSNREKYADAIENLPNSFEEVVIGGGCHAGFGSYGAQSGDGAPGISSEEQVAQTADAIAAMAAVSFAA